MQIYLVGGAVRDALLNRPIIERDWVVVGATVEQMLALGYTQVGKDFPVFLHPVTKDEYALARIERKQGVGYTGFVCDASSEVTLEQDLLRRDLTINAIAQHEDGRLIDPYGGQHDLENRIFRHVSDAFIEDPLRVFRVARFAARYEQYGFRIDPQTLSLMQKISASGELNALSAERVWKETARALLEANPWQYFLSLDQSYALSEWFAELALTPTTESLLTCLTQRESSLELRFACLVQESPSSYATTQLGNIERITRLCSRLKVPNDCRALALLLSKHSVVIQNIEHHPAEQALLMMNKTDAWRKPERFKQLLEACKVLTINAASAHYTHTPHIKNTLSAVTITQRKADTSELWWYEVLNALSAISAKVFVEQGLKGTAIKDAINHQRLSLISSRKKAAEHPVI